MHSNFECSILQGINKSVGVHRLFFVVGRDIVLKLVASSSRLLVQFEYRRGNGLFSNLN
jgi:hypothetical protein